MNTDTILNKITLSGNSTIVEMGFTCQICGNTQSLEYGYPPSIFPVCDGCKKDLKEIILEKRKTDLK